MKEYKKIEKKVFKDTLTNIICDNCKSDIILNDKIYYEICITKEIEYEGSFYEYLQFCSYGCMLNALEKLDINNNDEITNIEIIKEEVKNLEEEKFNRVLDELQYYRENPVFER